MQQKRGCQVAGLGEGIDGRGVPGEMTCPAPAVGVAEAPVVAVEVAALTADELRGAQVALNLAAALVHDEPTPAFVVALAQDGCLDEAPFGQDNPNVTRGLAQMRAWLAEHVASGDAADALAQPGSAGAQLEAAVADDAACELGREWLRLLVGAGEPQAPCWESYYTQDDHRLFSTSTVEVKRLYERHGMEVRSEGTEPADSLGFMLQFVAYLAGCEADALEVGGPLAQERADEQAMLEAHVLPWLPAWYERMKRHARTDFYAGVADLVFGLVQSFARRFGIGYYRSTNVFARLPQRSG